MNKFEAKLTIISAKLLDLESHLTLKCDKFEKQFENTAKITKLKIFKLFEKISWHNKQQI